MVIQKSCVTLRDGTAAELRSPEICDAEQMISYLHQTSEETHFMVRYPEECDRTLEAAQKASAGQLRTMRGASCLPRFWMASWSERGVNAMSDHFKMRHRASLGISIKKKAWGLGLGKLLMEKALEQAKENGFTQVELGGVCRQRPRPVSVPEARIYRDGLHSEGVLSQGRHVPR